MSRKHAGQVVGVAGDTGVLVAQGGLVDCQSAFERGVGGIEVA